MSNNQTKYVKMTTPIVDFVSAYANKNISRLHMPAHKGSPLLGCEALDITEISGADVLYSADGIIEESEENATSLFNTKHTFYSTEGSTLAIKAMLAIIKKNVPKNTTVLATRNVHKSFVYACGLLDITVEWLYPKESEHLCDCNVTPEELSGKLQSLKDSDALPCSLYVTSPTYLGKMLDIKGLSEVCKKFGIFLLVDNAHGAYLAFESPSMHPIALGADICCDSAHKTLPTLTGGAYLHISRSFKHYDKADVRAMLSLFASTSPSYLILQSLDLTNAYLADGFTQRLANTEKAVSSLKAELAEIGFECEESEPLKIVIHRKKCGYSGDFLAEHLRAHRVEAEYSDCDTLTLMASTETKALDFERIKSALSLLTPKKQSNADSLPLSAPEQIISIREALFAQSERISVQDSLGRICASPSVSCPPAIPPIISGERIDSDTLKILLYYGITEIDVIKE